MNTFFKDFRATMVLGIPLILAQLCLMAMSLTDAIIVGRGAGTDPLAALSFAVNFMNIPFIALYGLSSATSIYIARSFSAGRHDELPSILRHGIIISFLLAVVVAGVMLWCFEHLEAVGYLGQPAELMPYARKYIYFYSAAFLFQLCGGSCRAFCESQNRPWLPFCVILGTILLNIVLDYALVYGAFGLPQMGVAGAGLATLICAMVQFFALILSIIIDGRLHLTWKQLLQPKLDRAFTKKHLQLGIPTAFQIGVEISAMSIMALFAGKLGATTLAAHHVTMQVVGFLFMIPMGMSFAVSIRVSQAAGARDREQVIRVSNSGMTFAILWSSATMLLLFAFHRAIPGIFTHDEAVIDIASIFIIAGGLFQIFDAMQCTAMGALRGMKDVNRPMVLVTIIYWFIEMPVAWYLCFKTPLAGLGIWLSFSLGLGLAAAVLALRLKRISKTIVLGD